MANLAIIRYKLEKIFSERVSINFELQQNKSCRENPICIKSTKDT